MKEKRSLSKQRVKDSKVAKAHKTAVKGMVVKIPSSKVGNTKGGHGNFCGQSHMERMKGSKKHGEGLARK
tara:strand:+ start:809 stop:1018 length:210 start_codon:yes stop_codon:yes gene_type:complete